MPKVGKPRQEKRFKAKCLSETMTTDLPPPKWAVPGLLCEGVSLLSGAPKMGKSWMSLGIALAVAMGGKALGTRQVEQGDVLYLALEDQERRIKDRVLKVLPTMGMGDNVSRFFLVTDSPLLHEGGFESLREWISAASNPRLCVIDVWGRFRPQLSGNSQNYNADSHYVGEIKKIADHGKCPILLVHHTRKGIAEDIHEKSSGTNGLTGTTDTNMVLERPRMANDGKLSVTGRDVEEKVLSVRFDPQTCTWWEMSDPGEDILDDMRTRIRNFLTKQRDWSTLEQIASGIQNENVESVRSTLNKLVKDGVAVKATKPARWRVAL